MAKGAVFFFNLNRFSLVSDHWLDPCEKIFISLWYLCFQIRNLNMDLLVFSYPVGLQCKPLKISIIFFTRQYLIFINIYNDKKVQKPAFFGFLDY